jgi:uncharacterized protein (TIGR03089 family)
VYAIIVPMHSDTARAADILGRHVASRGDQPFLTYYDAGTGERTELGYATFANWVAKTANLLADSDVGRGDEVVVAADGHWTALVVAVACGFVGARAVLAQKPPAPEGAAALTVVHERLLDGPFADALVLGDGLGGRPVGGGTGESFVEAALAGDDHFDATDAAASDPWLVLPDGTTWTQQDALGGAGEPGRVLLTLPLEAGMAHAVRVLAAGGSIVTVRGGDDERRQRIHDDERCTATAP